MTWRMPGLVGGQVKDRECAFQFGKISSALLDNQTRVQELSVQLLDVL